MKESIKEQLMALGLVPEVTEKEDTSPFTFTTDDCISMRNNVLNFYAKICGAKRVPSVIDADNPEESVLFDFQMLVYLYMMMEGKREIDRATEITTKNGEKVIRKKAKPFLTNLMTEIRKILCYAPMNDVNFCSQYADIDDQLYEQMQNIVKNTYYPLLNGLLKDNSSIDSMLAQTQAHLVTALCIMVLACEIGMGETHEIPCQALYDIGPRIIKLSNVTAEVNMTYVDFDETKLCSNINNAKNIIVNSMNNIFMQILKHAKTLDLTSYIAKADMTKAQFEAGLEKLNQQKLKQILKK